MDPTKVTVNMDQYLLHVTHQSTDQVPNEIEKAVVWSEGLSIKLIKEFESHGVLWNPLHPFYYKSVRKLDAWQEVAKAVGKPAKACKYKISILMSSFRREKVKMMRFYHNGRGKGKFKSKWYAFEAMSFMLTKKQRQSLRSEDIVVTPSVHKYTRSRRTPKTEQAEESQTPEVVAVKIEKEEIDVDTPPSRSSTVVPAAARASTVDATCASTVDATCTSTSWVEEDEIVSFTNFVAAKMRRYGATARSIVQREIGDILYHADRNHYDGM